MMRKKRNRNKVHPALRPLTLKSYSRVSTVVSESGSPVDWGTLSEKPAERYRDTLSMTAGRERFLLDKPVTTPRVASQRRKRRKKKKGEG